MVTITARNARCSAKNTSEGRNRRLTQARQSTFKKKEPPALGGSPKGVKCAGLVRGNEEGELLG
jgi:hypothetical protein